MRTFAFAIAILTVLTCGAATAYTASAASVQATTMGIVLTPVLYHLTARPWQPLNTPKNDTLDKIDGIVRFTAHCQNTDGAIIDPVIRVEQQYATPYYAHALGVLLKAGRAKDLLSSGVRAMDWSTRCFETNRTSGHRVFYIHALVESLPLYKPFVSADVYTTWCQRLKASVAPEEAYDNNWSTYLMNGDWLRAREGLMDHDTAVNIIESKWDHSQRERISRVLGNLYHDGSSDPDTLAVEAVGRGNLLALADEGYDGPSAAAIESAAEAGSQTALMLQDPSGQAPCNGRTDDHVWVDIGYQLSFQEMAENMNTSGETWLAGQFRRAALLAERNIDRWRRTDGAWGGSFYVTKNHFDPTLRVGYQDASQYSNYNGSLMHHLAEAYMISKSDIVEHPAPTEIGGYAFALDHRFATAFANAGGMQMQIDLRGDTERVMNKDYWSALGAVRFGRTGWDTRLGPSDGVRAGTGEGVSFAPTFLENGKWVRLASVPDRYEGEFSESFVHPLLVRCAVDYKPIIANHGPSFHQDFTLTPDGILCTLTQTAGSGPWGVTLPVLSNDGRALDVSVAAQTGIASTRYAAGQDEQNFIVLGDNVELTAEPPLRSTYGDLVPVRATTAGPILRVFIYPRSPSDPPAQRVRESLNITRNGFSSVLGTVDGSTYTGRYAAGGVGPAFRYDLAKNASASFDQPCGILMQLRGGRVTAVESDTDTTATIGGRQITLRAHTPKVLSGD